MTVSKLIASFFTEIQTCSNKPKQCSIAYCDFYMIWSGRTFPLVKKVLVSLSSMDAASSSLDAAAVCYEWYSHDVIES